MKQVKLFATPRREDVDVSINACLDNAQRLIDGAERREFEECGATGLALSMLAQEECAKAFILYMVREGMVPWDASLLRVIRSHSCKHLVALVIEYLEPEWETIEELRAIISAEHDLEGRFPPQISSALNLLYFEKIRGENFLYEREYESDVKEIANGERDRIKQDALYIDLDRSCRVKKSPTSISQADAKKELELAERYKSAVRGLLQPNAYEHLQLAKLREAVTVVYWQHYRRQTEPPVSS